MKTGIVMSTSQRPQDCPRRPKTGAERLRVESLASTPSSLKNSSGRHPDLGLPVSNPWDKSRLWYLVVTSLEVESNEEIIAFNVVWGVAAFYNYSYRPKPWKERFSVCNFRGPLCPWMFGSTHTRRTLRCQEHSDEINQGLKILHQSPAKYCPSVLPATSLLLTFLELSKPVPAAGDQSYRWGFIFKS